MSKKYEKKIKHLKEQMEERDHDHGNKSSNIDVRNISHLSVRKQKEDLKNIKKKIAKSRKIW